MTPKLVGATGSFADHLLFLTHLFLFFSMNTITKKNVQADNRKYTEAFVDSIYAEAIEFWTTALRKTEIRFAVFLTHRANAAVDPVLALRMILDRHRGQPQP